LADSNTWVPVSTLDDLWDGEMATVSVDGTAVLLANIGGEVVAYEDRCPHAATPLSRGDLKGNVLTCSAHEWVFDCRTGGGINPAVVCLRRFAVRLDGDAINVCLEEPE
jgi:toluene monooxygenase system ferredoxin subunit